MTNTTERGFEIPFCHLLISEGHEIIHVDSHSPTENGKDIISIDANGKLCGFQLKSGNISVARFREEVHGELRELAELPCHHPRVPGQLCHGHLVTTGTLNEPSLQRLERFNLELGDRFSHIELVDYHALVRRFVDAGTVVLPTSPKDYASFLSIYLEPGQDYLKEKKLTNLLTNLPLHTGTIGEQRRRTAASLMIVGQAISSKIQAKNSWAQALAYTHVLTNILRNASLYSWDRSIWEVSAKAAASETIASIQALAIEAMAHDNLVEGQLLGDGGFVWRSRLTILVGVVALNCLLHRINGLEFDETDSHLFIEKHKHLVYLWGESCAPFIYCIYWMLKLNASTCIDGENYLAMLYCRTVCKSNNSKSGGIPNPYHDIESCLSMAASLSEHASKKERFRGSTYTVLPAIHSLRRCMRRQLLNIFWHDVSELASMTMEFDTPADYLQYEARHGKLRSSFFPRPTSWRTLGDEAGRLDPSKREFYNSAFHGNLDWILIFLVCHPHRLNKDIVHYVEQSLGISPKTE